MIKLSGAGLRPAVLSEPTGTADRVYVWPELLGIELAFQGDFSPQEDGRPELRRHRAFNRQSFLDRIDLVFDELVAVSNRERSWRLINNFNANHRFSATTQMSLQYAFKYVRAEFAANGFNGFTDLIGIDVRRALRGRWDVGLHSSIYHSYRSRVIDYGAGLDVGYNVATNVWLTLGYNVMGVYDEDFTQARYTAQGPYLRFSIKADQRTLKDIAGQR